METTIEKQTDHPGTIKHNRTRTPKAPIPVNPEAFNWGKREFGIIAKSFEGESKELQNTMIAISGLLQIVKLNLNEQPLVIIYLIKKSYANPGIFSEEKLLELLEGGTLDLGLHAKIAGYLLPEFLTTLADYTLALSSTAWNAFWDGMFKSIAATLTQWEKVCIYAPYVYNVLVKPVVK